MNYQSSKILQKLLEKMIEREEQLPEIIKNAPDADVVMEFDGKEELKIFGHKDEVVFSVNRLHLNLILTPKQMVAFIKRMIPQMGMYVQDYTKEYMDGSEENRQRLYKRIIMLLQSHPSIARKLTGVETFLAVSRYFKYPDVQDAPFNLFEPLPELNYETFDNLLSLTTELDALITPKLETGDGRSSFIWKLTHNKVVSYFDQTVILFREELGVHSLKEVESMESALCYLIYRRNWLRENVYLVDSGKLDARRAKNLSRVLYPDKTVYEFFSDTEGFNGELWASYEEFLHDEWLNKGYVYTMRYVDSVYHEGDSLQEVYRQLRKMALQES